MTIHSVVSQVKENLRIYGGYKNSITLSLWGLALVSHAILVPKLMKELRGDLRKDRK